MRCFDTPLARLRLAGIVEGASFLLLLGIAMPLKYIWGEPGAVRSVGMAHGLLWMLYVWLGWAARSRYRWPWRVFGWLALASLLPFGPFVADARLLRPNGRNA